MDELQTIQSATLLEFPKLQNTPRSALKFSGVISGPMWKKVESLKSKYPDRFDYSLYDRLHERFGENQPRGGVVFKNFIKLLESEDCKNCFYRFEIDSYGRGCVFNCAYCYAKSYLSIRKFWNEPMPFPMDVAELRKIFATVFETDKQHKFRKAIENRVPIRIGSMSDAFMWIDRKYHVTKELLKILRFYQYPYIIFTRSDLVAHDDYMTLLDRKLASVQMSISSINEELTAKVEPGAPSPKRRLLALERLAKNGFWTTVRINPLFPIYPDGYFTNPSFDHTSSPRAFNYFSWDMIEIIAQHSIPSLLVGIGRLYGPSMQRMGKAIGFSPLEFFSSGEGQDRAGFHFSQAETQYYYTRIKELCRQFNVRFSVCYIGNEATGAAFERYRPMWDNKKDCCDALGNVSGFKATCGSLHPEGSAIH